jgi:hypothetical protein
MIKRTFLATLGALLLIGVLVGTGWSGWVRDDAVGPVDAVVVLSAAITDDGGLMPSGIARLATGLRTAPSVPLYTTRVMRRIDGVLVNSDAAQRRIVGRDSLRWKILDSAEVRTTRDEVEQMQRVLPTGVRLAVVTSPDHTRRACAAIEAVGFAVTCVATDEPRTLRAYLYERLAMLKYRGKGWL